MEFLRACSPFCSQVKVLGCKSGCDQPECPREHRVQVVLQDLLAAPAAVECRQRLPCWALAAKETESGASQGSWLKVAGTQLPF